MVHIQTIWLNENKGRLKKARGKKEMHKASDVDSERMMLQLK